MSLQLPDLGYGTVALIVATIAITNLLSRGPKLNLFPTAGSNNWLVSRWAGLKFLTNAQKLIQIGYNEHNPAPFKIAELFSWTVILSDRKHLEELAWVSADKLSFQEATNDEIQTRYTAGHETVVNPYHVGVIRSQFTRKIDVLYPAIREEIITSFADVLNLSGNDWKSIPALSAITNVICRTSNRMFVGLPLCRDPDWIDLNIRYTVDVIKGGIITGLFPKFMRPFAVRFLTNIPRSVARGLKLLGPMIEERQKHLQEYGAKWDDMPDDLLSWLMNEAKGPELTAERLTGRVLIVNFAAVHTTSNSFTQALFYLAANPQYIQPLREEVEHIVEKEGWTKIALSKMRKVDSFLKECLRIDGLKLTTLSRKALTDYTFSDGTFIPKGASVAVPAYSMHHDERFYANPETFDPFRYTDLHEEDGKGQRHHLASVTPEYLPFGLGRHACAGRFFAATELKTMLAHVVMVYDVKLETNATHPPNMHIGTFVSVDPHAKIMFRNRVH